MTAELITLLDGKEVGRVRRDARGRLSFIYDDAWRNAPDAYPLSLSMPLVGEGCSELQRAKSGEGPSSQRRKRFLRSDPSPGAAPHRRIERRIFVAASVALEMASAALPTRLQST